MRKLTPHFDHVIVAIQESDMYATMKMLDLIWSLEAQEMRILE